MFKKASLQLAALAVLLFAQSQGSPASENKDGIEATPTRDARIRPSDWLHFNHSWSFPSLPSVTDLFGGADNKEGRVLNLRRRVAALETSQKSMNEILKNLTRDVSALTAIVADIDDGTPISPALPDKGDGKPTSPALPDKGDGKPTSPALPDKGDGKPTSPALPDKGDGKPTSPARPDKGDGKPTSPALPDKGDGKPTGPTLAVIPDFETYVPSFPEGTSSEKPSKPAGFPVLPPGILPEELEAAEEPDTDTLIAVPLKTKGKAAPNLASGGSSAPEIPEKIVIASTSLEDSPGENPFGSISLVSFTPSHDSRHNSRMPLNKDHKSNEKAN